jgi:signal transduction histidine kinase
MAFRERLRSLDARWVDLAFAAGIAVWFLVELLTRDPRGTDRVATAITGAVLLASLAWRSRRPELPCLAFAVVVLVQSPLDGGLMEYFDSAFAVLFGLLYTVGRYTRGRTTVALALLLYASASVALAESADESVPVDLLWGLGLCLPPVLVGRALHVHRSVRDELAAAEQELAADDERRAALAVEDERARIAAELQTVLANDVSAIVVQAEAVHRVIAIGEQETAREALRLIEETGRGALVELRRLLGVLRHDYDGPSLQPQPGVADIATLQRPRGDGAPEVIVALDATPAHVSAGVDLAAYWIAQRAVEAADAAGAEEIEVSVGSERGRIALRITDDRPVTHASDADAALLAAIRARAELYGGHVRVSRAGDARVLEAVLPLRGSEVAA